MSMTKHYPSLQAFKDAKAGKPAGPAQAQDALAHLYEHSGFWFNGAIADQERGPLPEIVEIKGKADAKQLAAKGGRPLHQGDPDLIAMTLGFYAPKEGEVAFGEKKEEGQLAAPEMPPAIKALAALVKEREAAAKAAALEIAAKEKGKK